MEKFLGSFNKSKSGRIDVAFKEYQNKTYLDIRKMYFNKDKEEFLPTSKGIFIPVDKIESLQKALKLAMKEAEDNGLLNEEQEAPKKEEKVSAKGKKNARK